MPKDVEIYILVKHWQTLDVAHLPWAVTPSPAAPQALPLEELGSATSALEEVSTSTVRWFCSNAT